MTYLEFLRLFINTDTNFPSNNTATIRLLTKRLTYCQVFPGRAIKQNSNGL